MRDRGSDGHIRVGLWDAPSGTLTSNLALVEAVRLARDHGAEPASAAAMRQALRSSMDST